MANSSELRVLLALASPEGTERLSLLREFRTIQASKERFRQRQIKVELRAAATIDDLRRALLEAQFDVVHISTHGSEVGYLVLNDEYTRKTPVPSRALADLFAAHSPPVQCVVLNGCHSLSIGDLTSMEVPFTIAMEGSLDDEAAIKFSGGFYDAICAGRSYRQAYDEGVRAVYLAAPNFNFQPKFIPNDAKIAELARAITPALGLIDAYRRRVHAQYEHVRLDLTEETLSLDDSYIRLSLAPPVAKPNDKERKDQHAPEIFEAEAACAKYPALWIEGDPGAGKTTLLYYLMRRLSAPDAGRLVPVYVASETVTANRGLLEAIRDRVGCVPADAPDCTFVVLVDAVDQASDPLPILQQTSAMMSQGNVRLVTTSRPSLPPPVPSLWIKMLVQPLSEDLIREFLRKRSAGELAERLPAEVRSGGVLSVPLLLHIAAKIVFRVNGGKQLTRVSLLGQLLDYVDEREASKGRSLPAGIRPQLEALAWRMRIAAARTMFDGDLAKEAGLSADDVRQLVRSGVVRKEGAGFSFAHLLIAEFLAAVHLARQPPDAFPLLLWSSWEPLFTTEVLPLACALWRDLDDFLRTVLLRMPGTAGTTRLRLYGRCLAERPVAQDESALALRVRTIVRRAALHQFVEEAHDSGWLNERASLWASFAGEPAFLEGLEVPAMQARAIAALGRLRSAKAVNRLASIARDLPDLRYAAFTALQSIGPAAFEILTALVDDPSTEVKQGAVRALDWSKSERAAALLTGLLDDADTSIRQQAIYSMSWVIDVLPPSSRASVFARLIALLRDPTLVIRAVAADALGARDLTEYAAPVLAMLYDASPDVRVSGVRAIGKRNRHLDPERMSALLDDADPEVQVHAIYAIDSLDDAAIDVLGKKLDSSHQHVREAAAIMLGKTKNDRAVGYLLPHLLDISYVLISMESERAIAPLIAALDDPLADNRAGITMTLSRILEVNSPCEPLLDRMLPWLDSPDLDRRKTALEVLRESHSPRLVAPLLRLLRDPDCGFYASLGLERIASDSLIDSLVPLLSDPAARSQAGHVLLRIGTPRAVQAVLGLANEDDRSSLKFYLGAGSWRNDAATLARVVEVQPDTLESIEGLSDVIFPFPGVSRTLEAWKWSLYPAKYQLENVAGTTLEFECEDDGHCTLRLGDRTVEGAVQTKQGGLLLSLPELRSFADVGTEGFATVWSSDPAKWLIGIAPELGRVVTEMDADALSRSYTIALIGLYFMGLSRPDDMPLAARYADILGGYVSRTQSELNRLVVRAWLTACVVEVLNPPAPIEFVQAIVNEAVDRDGASAAFDVFIVSAFAALEAGRRTSVLYRAPFATWIRIGRTTIVDPVKQPEDLQGFFNPAIMVVEGPAPIPVRGVDELWSGLRTGIVAGELSISPLSGSQDESKEINPAFKAAAQAALSLTLNDYFAAMRLYRPILPDTYRSEDPEPAKPESPRPGRLLRRFLNWLGTWL